jgi:hypothetical protein
MDKAQDPGPDRLVGQRDVAGTGPLRYPLTSFVGRERELDEIRSPFREGMRLVTVSGIGGIGKTCLALQLCLSAGDLGNLPQAGGL